MVNEYPSKVALLAENVCLNFQREITPEECLPAIWIPSHQRLCLEEQKPYFL